MNKRNKVLALLLSVFLFAAAALPGAAAGQALEGSFTGEMERGFSFLSSAQNPDGGFGSSPGSSSSSGMTSWVLMALESAESKISDGYSLMHRRARSYLLRSFEPANEATIDLARNLVSLSGSSNEKVDAGVRELKRRLGSDGHYGLASRNESRMVNVQVWSIFALARHGEEIPSSAGEWLAAAQNSNGGYGWATGGSSDTDSTAAAVAALKLAGYDNSDDAIRKGLNYLQLQKTSGGGYKTTEAPANSSTNAWVIMGLRSLGEDLSSPRWAVSGKTVVDHLLSLQKRSGAFWWTESSDATSVLTTAQGLMALSGKSFNLPLSAFSRPASEPEREKEEQADPISLVIDGRTLQTDEPPLLRDGRTFVPLRIIADDFGASVHWEGETKTVTMEYSGETITLRIGQDLGDMGSPRIISSRTYVPLRYVAETFGASVEWISDSQGRRVEITR